MVGRALVEHRRGAVRERPVDDVRVPRDPADVGRAPVDVGVGLQVEDVLVGVGDLGQVAARRVHDALGLPRGSRRVEDEQEILGVHRLGLALRWLSRDLLVPPHVATGLHLAVRLGAPEDEDVLDARRLSERLVGDVLQRDDRAAAPRAVGGDEDARLGVVDPILERLRGESSEHHRVRGADARAREHRGDGLGDHPHVDRDSIALRDTELAQQVRDATRLVEQLLVGHRAAVAGFAFPVQRDLATVTGAHVAVETVLGDVEATADEPLRERQLPLEDGVPLTVPVEGERLLRPEALPVALGIVVDTRVGDQRLLRELGRRREGAAFLQQCGKRLSHARGG